MKFARIEGKREQKDYVVLYAGKTIEYIKRDIGQFSDDYDIKSFEEVPFSYLANLCEKGWGQYQDKKRGHGKIFSAINAIEKGSNTYCIDHIIKEAAYQLEIEAADLSEDSKNEQKDRLEFKILNL